MYMRKTTLIFQICILLLMALQFGFQMNTKLGYLSAAAIGAIAITAIFVKYNDSIKELDRVENGIGRIIRLQNTVKIRYVNNTHLLDYLYMKYNVSSPFGRVNARSAAPSVKSSIENRALFCKVIFSTVCPFNVLRALLR